MKRWVTKNCIEKVIRKFRPTDKQVEYIQCPVCGYFCAGKGGFFCINKASMIEAHNNSLSHDAGKAQRRLA